MLYDANKIYSIIEVKIMWKKLYDAAVKVQNARIISPFIEAGGVAVVRSRSCLILRRRKP